MINWMREPFQTIEDVKEYVSGDKIQCLICGKWYKQLGNHIRQAHDVSCEMYREHLNIPSGIPLWGNASLIKLIDFGKSRDPEYLQQLIKKANTYRHKRPPDTKPHNLYVSAMNKRESSKGRSRYTKEEMLEAKKIIMEQTVKAAVKYLGCSRDTIWNHFKYHRIEVVRRKRRVKDFTNKELSEAMTLYLLGNKTLAANRLGISEKHWGKLFRAIKADGMITITVNKDNKEPTP